MQLSLRLGDDLIAKTNEIASILEAQGSAAKKLGLVATVKRTDILRTALSRGLDSMLRELRAGERSTGPGDRSPSSRTRKRRG